MPPAPALLGDNMQVPRGALAGAKPEPGCGPHALRRTSELPRGLFRLPRQ